MQTIWLFIELGVLDNPWPANLGNTYAATEQASRRSA